MIAMPVINQPTHQEVDRQFVGGEVSLTDSHIKKELIDTIDPEELEAYLKKQGLPKQAVDSFLLLNQVKEGESTDKRFQLTKSIGQLEEISIRVERDSSNKMRIGLLWVEVTARITCPQIKIKYRIQSPGTTVTDVNSNTHENTSYLSRGLTSKQTENISQSMKMELSIVNAGQKLRNMLK